MNLPSEVDAIDNPHLIIARQKFLREDAVSEFLDTQFLFLCFTNRCGSNYVAEALASDGTLNIGGEFFNADSIQLEEFRAKTLCEYFKGLINQVGKNGRVVAKLAITQAKLLNEFGVLSEILPRSKFILVQRADVLGQAISLEIAWQNQQWVSSMIPRIPDAELVFSAEKLKGLVEDITTQNALFERFFALNDVVPFVLNYEQFIGAPAFFLDRISAWLGLVPPIRYISSAISIERQRRAVNRAWRQQFLAELLV